MEFANNFFFVYDFLYFNSLFRSFSLSVFHSFFGFLLFLSQLLYISFLCDATKAALSCPHQTVAKASLRTSQDSFQICWTPIPLVLQRAVFQRKSLIKKAKDQRAVDTADLCSRPPFSVGDLFLPLSLPVYNSRSRHYCFRLCS